MDDNKFLIVEELRKDSNTQLLLEKIPNKKFGYYTANEGDLKFLFRLDDRIITQDFSLLDFWDEDMKEKYVREDETNLLVSLMRGYKMNFVDALLISFVCNKDMSPNLNTELLHSKLLRGAENTTIAYYTEYYDSNCENNISVDLLTHRLKRSTLRRNNKEPLKVISGTIFMDVLESEKLVVKDYNKLITLYNGGLDRDFFTRIKDGLVIVNDIEEIDDVINFRDGEISLIMSSGITENTVYKVKLKYSTVELNENGITKFKEDYGNLSVLEQRCLSVLYENQDTIYKMHLKKKGVEIDTHLVESLFNLANNYSSIDRSSLKTTARMTKPVVTKETLEMYEKVYNKTFRGYYTVIQPVEIRNNLLLVDKIYNFTNDSNRNLVRDILDTSSVSHMFPEVYDKDIYNEQAEVMSKMIVSAIEDTKDDYEYHKSLSADSYKSSGYYYVNGSYRTIFCHSSEMVGIIEQNIENTITEAHTIANTCIIYKSKLKEISRKVPDILLGVNKTEWKKLLSTELFIVDNLLKLNNDGLLKYLNGEAEFNTVLGHGLLENDIRPLKEEGRFYSRNFNIAVVLFGRIKKDYNLGTALKVLTYIVEDCKDRQGITSGAVSIYSDYYNMYNSLVESGYNTKESLNLFPYSLKLAHDTTTLDYRAVEKNIEEHKFAEIYGDVKVLEGKTVVRASKKEKPIRLYLPKSPDDVRREGEDLSHCVASYVRRIIDKECFIVFARYEDRKEKSLYTVEIKKVGSGRYTLGQTKGMNNREMSKDKREKIKEIISKYLHNNDSLEVA